MKKLFFCLISAIWASVIVLSCRNPYLKGSADVFIAPDTFLYPSLLDNYVPKGISKMEIFNEENNLESTSTYDSLSRLCQQKSNSLFGDFRCYSYKGTSLFPLNEMYGSDVSRPLFCHSQFDPKTNRLYFVKCVAGKEKGFPQNVESSGYYQYDTSRHSLIVAKEWLVDGIIEEITFREVSDTLSVAETRWSYKIGSFKAVAAQQGIYPFYREARIFKSPVGVDSITTQTAFQRETIYGNISFQKGWPAVQAYKKKSRINDKIVYTCQFTFGNAAHCNCIPQ